MLHYVGLQTGQFSLQCLEPSATLHSNFVTFLLNVNVEGPFDLATVYHVSAKQRKQIITTGSQKTAPELRKYINEEREIVHIAHRHGMVILWCLMSKFLGESLPINSTTNTGSRVAVITNSTALAGFFRKQLGLEFC